MANSLQGVLASIPGLAGYAAAQQNDQQLQGQQLGQMSQLMQLQRAVESQQREQGLRQELAALGPEATQEQLAQVAAKYGTAGDILKTQQSSLDRKAQLEAKTAEAQQRREAATEMQRERITAAAEAARLRAEDARLSQAERNQARIEMIRLAASLRQAPQPQAPVVTEVFRDGKNVKIDARTGAVIGEAPAKAPTEKALPPGLQKQLTEAAELADSTTRFATTFKPEFGGYTVTGGLSNTYGRVMGDDTGQAQWWQDYELHQSQVRNKLFGSALTAPEIAAWNKSAINPRMDPGEIQKNLDRRKMLEERGLERLMKGATAGRFNREQIEAFTGRPAPAVPGRGTERSVDDILNQYK